MTAMKIEKEHRDKIRRLKAEVDRMEAALHKTIMRIQWHRSWNGQAYEQLAVPPGAAEKIVNIAEEALNGIEENGDANNRQ
jgi:hypothetical protein